jgi:hypothetical protein
MYAIGMKLTILLVSRPWRQQMSDQPTPWTVRNRPASLALFGLCAFETAIQTDRPTTEALFEVALGGTRARLPARAVAKPLGETWQSTFHVNTHLLPNGTHALQVLLKWPDGSMLVWPTVSVEVNNTGALATEVAKDLASFGTPMVFGSIVDSALFPFERGQALAWFNKQPAHQVPELSFQASRDTESARRHLSHWGFCVLNSALPLDLIQNFNREIDEAIADGTLLYTPGSSERVYGAHRLPSGKKVWLFPPVIRFLREWFRDEPSACQSLLYVNGSEQSAHQDTIHLTPYPAGYMCGVWVALEDVQPDSGELFVYPGSQREPRLMSSDLNLSKVSSDYSSYVAFDRRVQDLLERGGYERQVYRPKAGEILIWHENLIHGGSRRVNPRISRRSIVSHYFSQGGIAFYDSRGEAAFLEPVF